MVVRVGIDFWDVLVHHVMIHGDVLFQPLGVVLGLEQDQVRGEHPERRRDFR